jgi:hypothetical protein
MTTVPAKFVSIPLPVAAQLPARARLTVAWSALPWTRRTSTISPRIRSITSRASCRRRPCPCPASTIIISPSMMPTICTESQSRSPPIRRWLRFVLYSSTFSWCIVHTLFRFFRSVARDRSFFPAVVSRLPVFTAPSGLATTVPAGTI